MEIIQECIGAAWAKNALFCERLSHVLCTHRIEPLVIPLFLKYIALTSTKPLASAIAAFFEISALWLQGESDQITDITPTASMSSLLQYLLYVKQQGLKPNLIFLYADENHMAVLIELLKVTKTGISVTVYKLQLVGNSEEMLQLSQKAAFFCRGFYIKSSDYQRLVEGNILPVQLLNCVQNLWLPKTQAHSSFPANVEMGNLVETIRYTSVIPTYLV